MFLFNFLLRLFTIYCYRALAILFLFLNTQFYSAVFLVLANSNTVLQACDRVGSANCTPASVKDRNTKAVGLSATGPAPHIHLHPSESPALIPKERARGKSSSRLPYRSCGRWPWHRLSSWMLCLHCLQSFQMGQCLLVPGLYVMYLISSEDSECIQSC